MEFRLLGDVQAWQDGQVLALGAKQRAVLAVLAYRVNRVVSRAEIARLVWGRSPDQRPSTVDRLIADYVSRLRTGLRAVGADEEVRLVARQPGFALEADPARVDWHRFRALYGQARTARQAGDVDDAAGLLANALELWRGQALADLTNLRSLDPIRRELDNLRLAATEDMAVVKLDRGGAAEVVDILTELTARYPTREQLVALLIRALQATGYRSEAIAVYHRTRAHLARELGLDPGAALTEAYRAILGSHPPTVPRPAAARLRQLPLDTAVFRGRAAELESLLRLAPEEDSDPAGGVVRVCAVDGMAGVGKTALVVHAAHQLASRFPDGSVFIDLHGHTRQVARVEPAEALVRILRALGVPGQQVPHHLDDLAAMYRSWLAGRRMLIVLDNAHTVEQVRPLLPAESGCLVLVTSRRRLAALDEAELLTLDPLPAADAVALFVRIAGPDRVAGHGDAVDRVIELCGRLPLAIRVAAARLRARPAWTVAHLACRLANQRDVLGELDDGDRSIPAAFALSYSDLAADEQRMFRRLGLHPGADIDRPAAAALAGSTPAEAGRLLEALLDTHLLTQPAPGRYGLHDLIGVYAAQLAHAEDLENSRRAALTGLFDHYQATAAVAMDTLYPADSQRRPRIHLPDPAAPPAAGPATALAWLDAERRNLVAVCAYATDDWPGHTIRLAATVATYLRIGGHLADSLTIHTHAREAARRTGDRTAEARALSELGSVHWSSGRHTQAADFYEQALAVFAGAGDRVGEARATIHLGAIRRRQGGYREALVLYEQALALCRGTGDRVGEARAITHVAGAHRRQGRYRHALALYQRALTLYQGTDDPIGEAHVRDSLGVLHQRQGHLGEAVDQHQRALALYRATSNRAGEAHTLTNLGIVHTDDGRHQHAVDDHQRALSLFRQINDRGGEAEALNGLGEALYAGGLREQARAHHTTALVLAVETDDPYEQARAHTGIAHVDHAAGARDQARRHWEEALTRYTRLDVPDANAVRAQLPPTGTP
jgi:DNA-binding SARP family transcriptional activator/tetratricopeptide (TPR) repeat protein